MITITKHQNKCSVEWQLDFNNRVIKRDYWFMTPEKVKADIKADPDYAGERIKVVEV